MSKSTELYKKAKTLIPGGTQLLTKRPELHLPDLWPTYFDKAEGCNIWDLDGNKYTDMSYMGIGANILGYSDPDVNQAIHKTIDKCNSTTLNPPEEVKLAELLIQLHPWANMVRYARSGGEAMAIAVRIARAYSKKDKVLFCGYHGWHDWYLAANLSEDNVLDGHLLPGLNPRGVPRGLTNTAIPFKYNDTNDFVTLFEKNKNEIGAVVMEPIRNIDPNPGFLETIRELTKKHRVPLVMDEITSGWRLNVGGAHLLYNIEPDIAVFGKGISNGYPMAAIIGNENVMQIAQETFISSTYWTERIGPVAALSTIQKMLDEDLPMHLKYVGEEIQKGWKKLAQKHELDIQISGILPLSHFTFNYKNTLVLKTFFTQLMLEKGFLGLTSLYASFAHTEDNIKQYLKAVDQAFYLIKHSIIKNNSENLLRGQVCQTGFRRLT